MRVLHLQVPVILELDNGFNDPTTICCATPAAMKSPTPLPNPHFETTSSRNIMSIPPMVICRIRIHCPNPGAGGSAPVSTSTDAFKECEYNCKEFLGSLEKCFVFGF